MMERDSRIWVVNVENINNEFGLFRSFELPFKDRTGKVYRNTKEVAKQYYLEVLDSYSTLSDDRIINSQDVYPRSLLKIIPEKKPAL